MERIVLFDGVCNLCNSSVQFIIKRDPKGYFKFASLQSVVGNDLLTQYGLNQEIDSLVLIENKTIYMRSTAALRIGMKLHGFWKFLAIFLIVPPTIRDFLYKIVAKNRYNWFGKRESCMLPTPEMKNRFIN
ncbi:thiol-disulfide oxidoreductase DCC family protein [Neobacillus sp. K501]